MTAPPLQLFYWDIRGSAQPIRHLLEYLKTPYVETTYIDPAKWYTESIEKVGQKCLFPSLPYIVDGDFYLSEPVSISKYICQMHNREDLLGRTLEEQGKVDEILAKYVIFNNKLANLFRITNDKEAEEPEKWEKLFAEIMSLQYFPYIIHHIEDREWVFESVTVVDFFVYESLFYMTGIFNDKLKSQPHLLRYMRRFEELEEIKAYNESDKLMTKTFMGDVVRDHWKGDPKFAALQSNSQSTNQLSRISV